MNNMRIWDAVQETNPDNTKAVNQRGGFTSICAQSQIMEATRQFGPIGEGWGYDADAPIFHDNLVFVRVTLWHESRVNSFGPMIGGAEWKDKNGRLDSDAPKKATTDALTKLLAQLGFNADVFMGLYDDNKYVEEMRRKFAEKAMAEKTPPQSVVMFLEGLRKAFDEGGAAVTEYWTKHWAATDKESRPYLIAEKDKLKAGHDLVDVARAA